MKCVATAARYSGRHIRWFAPLWRKKQETELSTLCGFTHLLSGLETAHFFNHPSMACLRATRVLCSIRARVWTRCIRDSSPQPIGVGRELQLFSMRDVMNLLSRDSRNPGEPRMVWAAIGAVYIQLYFALAKLCICFCFGGQIGGIVVRFQISISGSAAIRFDPRKCRHYTRTKNNAADTPSHNTPPPRPPSINL
ncbi:hypothetical protein C8R43DRAFT_131195 [Mycena crocata]|nr:hypothetical protein C8R43DRAFT_131195 [Mycena crocata]